jgi:hypothetical protein
MSQRDWNQRDYLSSASFAPGGRPEREGISGLAREWLGLKELSFYADISERTLRSWIYSPVDPLPAVKVCGKVLVRRTDFDAFLQMHRIKRSGEINLDAIVNEVVKGVRNGR